MRSPPSSRRCLHSAGRRHRESQYNIRANNGISALKLHVMNRSAWLINYTSAKGTIISSPASEARASRVPICIVVSSVLLPEDT